MTGGVISTDEFNEQVKRTVRETIRRERSIQRPVGRWHKKGSGVGGGIFARGVCDTASCASGTLDVDVSHMSNCDAIPDATGTVVTAVDVDGIMSGFTDAELVGASIRIGYYYDVTTCVGQWEIWSITGLDQCPEAA